MVVFWDAIPDNQISWILNQKIFWVATAPLNPDGHVNVSPKGVYGTFHVVDRNKVWYEDLSGSGVETISHIKENRRVTVMFCAFEGPPKIFRLFGKGTIHEFGTPEYSELIPPEKRSPGSRSAIVIDVYSASSSCGFAVPYFEYTAERTRLNKILVEWEGRDKEAEANSHDPAAAKPKNGLKYYWGTKNLQSLDGLTGLTKAYESSFKLTGYGTNDTVTITHTNPTAVEKMTMKLRPVLSDLGDMKLLLLLVGFLAGSLATSTCYRLLA